MQLFCQSCQAAFAATTHCPRCGSRLLSPQESFIHRGRSRKAPADPIAATFANRITMGTLVALGAAIGLRELHSVLTLFAGMTLADGWAESNANPMSLALRLAAVILGGLIAGAGRRGGVEAGAVVGLIFGVMLTGFDTYSVGRIQDWLPLALALAYPLLGGLAGATGTWLWPADAVLPEPTRISSHGSSMARLAVEDAERHIQHPTPWLRIAGGATVAMIAIIASEPIRMAMTKYSGGLLNTGGVYRSAWIGLQIGTIGLLLGGLIAGMGSRAGFKHGFYAALLAFSGLLIGASNQPNGMFPAIEGFLTLIGVEHGSLLSPRVGVDVLFGIVPLMTIAGGLGSQLLPPLVPVRFRTKRFMRMT